MDNKQIFLRAVGRKDFEAGMTIAFSSAPGKKAESYAILEDKGLAFLWHYDKSWSEKPFTWKLHEAGYKWITTYRDEEVKSPGNGVISIPEGTHIYGMPRGEEDNFIRAIINKVPYQMGVTQAIDFAWNWLCGGADYDEGAGKLDDFDVSKEKGFILETDGWGHVWDNHYGIIGIRPAWAWYGK